MSTKQKIILAVSITLVLVSGVMLFKTGMEYKKAKDEYNSLNQYTQAEEKVEKVVDMAELPGEAVSAPEPEESEEEEKELCPRNYNREDYPDLEVDFEGLKEVNPQCVAWLYVGSVDISYPVVQNPGEGENTYYLHKTFEGKDNSSGCIFMDWEVDPNLTSWNTFIYGHNMKNGSMFGGLKKLIYNTKLYENDPYIYLFKEDGIYRYKIYSFYLDKPDTKMYWTCDNLREYRAYVRTALENSVLDCGTEANEDINSITLVTCSGSGASKKRFFVHGALQDRYLYEDEDNRDSLEYPHEDEDIHDNVE